jgi:cohesin complex subunit SCC1
MMGRGGEGEDFFSHMSREPSEHPFGADMDVDMDFGPDTAGMDIDLGIDFGDRALSEHEKTPGQTRSPSRMCTLCLYFTPLHYLTFMK